MIGDKIKERRIELGLSQGELARLVGYADKSAIAKIESNSRDIPQNKVKIFAKCLMTTVPYLLELEEPGSNLNEKIIAELFSQNNNRDLQYIRKYISLPLEEKKAVENIIDVIYEKRERP